jgi:hypothetical protein
MVTSGFVTLDFEARPRKPKTIHCTAKSLLQRMTTHPGLSLGAGDRRNSPSIPPLIAGFFLNIFFVKFFCLLHQWIVLALSIK